MLNFKNNKKAQASEAMVWVIATLAIIIILTIFIFIAGTYAKTNGKIIDVVQVFKSGDLTNVDLIAAKNEIALDSFQPADRTNIEKWLNEVKK